MRKEKGKEIWSVSDLISYLTIALDEEDLLKGVWVEGEISNFSQHQASKHMYFTLKDEKVKMRAAMFSGNNWRLKFTPKDGDRVLVKANVALYERDGQLQLYVQELKLSGIGELYYTFAAMKQMLSAEGLFAAPKKTLPKMPQTIGVVTSPNGAAIQDILTTLARRFPLAAVLLFPVSVQGEGAAKEIAAAINILDQQNLDVIIVGRGGGSLEELWSFNDEKVVRSIFAAQHPVISAVGHETDTTLSDYVADVRAPTPTAAAEIAVPEQNELFSQFQNLSFRLQQAQAQNLAWSDTRLKRCINSSVFREPEQKLAPYARIVAGLYTQLSLSIKEQLSSYSQQMQSFEYRVNMMQLPARIKEQHEYVLRLQDKLLQIIIAKAKHEEYVLNRLIDQLDALSPLKTIQRGFSITYGKDKNIITSVEQVSIGDNLNIYVTDGYIASEIKRLEVRK